ncbi:MAG: site-specific integrase, partial [Nocardiaceae bacterium]|nr:site-specific integrase [Nocardiaceae bacterium]
ARLRHSSAVTTLNTYSHLWPDSEESTRKAVSGVLTERLKNPAYPARTEGEK